MTIHQLPQNPQKSLGETAICFACMAGVLTLAAFGLQWLLRLLP